MSPPKRTAAVVHAEARHPPSEVYTTGLQQGTQADARFTGKAVTFMTVAKFSTN